ncbi:MAG: Sec-independent protein translocase protein TatB [Sulfurimicrobium sp.]|jgi:sec-independent protein translocase protein TatB|nr:Sec-independent protein translocase protein TatB [Sulfurimicrobium sp.]MDZ7656948.1 Sec-independent protein translocase protein TatB [Sulfurimicrobium sp.]
MFDFGFSELVLIGVVALVVIGPERLPKVARTAGHLFGRMQRYVSDVKADINREIQLDELKKMQEEMHASVNSIEQSVTKELHQSGQEFQSAAEQIHEIIEIPQADSATASPDVPAGHESDVVEAPPPQLELNLEPQDQPGTDNTHTDVKEIKNA